MSLAALIVSLTSCVASVLGVSLNRDRRTEEDAVWRGEVNGKLDVVCGIKNEVEALRGECRENAAVLAAVDASTKSAHHRIDELSREMHQGT